MTHEPTVFLVDDDEAVRDALSLSLKEAGFQVECFEGGEKFLAAYTDERPGCLLLDLCMPGMDGLTVQSELVQRKIEIPIVLMTAYGTIRDSVSAIKAGAFDFLEKPVSRPLLLDRIRNALTLDTQLRQIRQHLSQVQARYERLSPREREIMGLIAEGVSSKKIAQMLGISPRTVDAHRARLMVKMQASSVAELGAMSAQCTGAFSNPPSDRARAPAA